MKLNFKTVLMIIFFPFTLTYLIWKQAWSNKIKILATVALWAVFIGIGSTSKPSTQTALPSPTPVKQEEQKPTHTLEQKQDDFKSFYIAYTKRGQALILIRDSIIKIADVSGSKEQLYLALDKISTMLDSVSSFDNDIPTPDSLKEYKDLSSAKGYLSSTATAYKSAVSKYMVYLDKNDLKAYKDVKSNIERGDQNLSDSHDAVDKVAEELQIDTSQIKIEQ